LTPTVAAPLVNAVSALGQIKKPAPAHKSTPNKSSATLDFSFLVLAHAPLARQNKNSSCCSCISLSIVSEQQVVTGNHQMTKHK
jgi:hypothetical protein